jgi:nicotinamidase-related amidase
MVRSRKCLVYVTAFLFRKGALCNALYAPLLRSCKKWDDGSVEELRALVRPGDNELFEMALQTAFTGTQMPLELSRKGVKLLVLTGIHLDWCIEGNARAARDNGYLPIVIGDAARSRSRRPLR